MRLYKFMNEDDNDKLARWGNTFGENHGILPDEKGFHEACVTHMEGNIDDPEAYCARVKDSFMQSTYWRNKKSDKEVKAAVKAHQNTKLSKAAKADISKK
jgi:hypothetical protein